MATVRSAKTGSGSPFAFKVMGKAQLAALKQMTHVSTMDDIAPRLDHPHLMKTEPGLAHDARCVYQVLELCEQGDLFDPLRRAGRFEGRMAAHVAAQVGDALAYLHRFGIAHRNIKPESILHSGGLVKLGCHIFIKACRGEQTFTLCGTPEYIAPEILLSKGHGPEVDVWALGVLLFEMLTGHPPWYADDPMAIYQKVLHGQLSFPRFIDRVHKAFMLRCLVADVNRRIRAHKLHEHPALPTGVIGQPCLYFGALRGSTDYAGMPFDTEQFKPLGGPVADAWARELTPHGHPLEALVPASSLHMGLASMSVDEQMRTLHQMARDAGRAAGEAAARGVIRAEAMVQAGQLAPGAPIVFATAADGRAAPDVPVVSAVVVRPFSTVGTVLV